MKTKTKLIILIIAVINLIIQLGNLIFLSTTHPEISIVISIISYTVAVAAAAAGAIVAAGAGAVVVAAVAAGAGAGAIVVVAAAAGAIVAAAGAIAAFESFWRKNNHTPTKEEKGGMLLLSNSDAFKHWKEVFSLPFCLGAGLVFIPPLTKTKWVTSFHLPPAPLKFRK